MVFQVQNISDRKQRRRTNSLRRFSRCVDRIAERNAAVRPDENGGRAREAIKDYKFAVLFIDLDRFKVVNDTMGHEMGDKLAHQFVAPIGRLAFARKIDTVARLGGDEFAILLDGIPDHALALKLPTRIQESLSQPFDLDGQEFFTSASIGISFSSMGYDRRKIFCATPTLQCIAPKPTEKLVTKFSTSECTRARCRSS
jgi:diguanylate cyclase (GGDEF)-like protein